MISFLQDEVIGNPTLLFNELENLSLFEERKIIFIENANDKLLKIIEKYLEGELNFQLIIFSEALEKKSKLRSFYEKSKKYASVPCYPDNLISIQNIIQNELKNFQGLSSINLNIILEACGNDRIKVYNEIDKIISFFDDKKITTENLSKLLNSPSIDDFNSLKDEVIKGNKHQTNKLIDITLVDQDKGIYYLSLIQSKILQINRYSQNT